MKDRVAALKRLARSAELFYPDLADHFLCPTCLAPVPLTKSQDISEAHIVPRAAGGGMKTFLCRKCNSAFGTKQDKWMGEYVRIASLPKRSFLHTQHKAGHFEIEGVRVSGTYEITDEGGLDFLVWQDKTAPPALQQLEAKMADAPGKLEIKVPVPLLKNRALIDIGFLTAAYLLWFRSWGYSWALQAHLGFIREQIRQPDSTILQRRQFIATCEDRFFMPPAIGIGVLGKHPVLFAGISNRVVMLPPMSARDFYANLPEDFADCGFRIVRELTIHPPHKVLGPVGVLYTNTLMIAPDVLLRNLEDARFLLFSPEGDGPLELSRVSDHDYERLMASGAKVKRLKISLEAPERETGKPTP